MEAICVGVRNSSLAGRDREFEPRPGAAVFLPPSQLGLGSHWLFVLWSEREVLDGWHIRVLIVWKAELSSGLIPPFQL